MPSWLFSDRIVPRGLISPFFLSRARPTLRRRARRDIPRLIFDLHPSLSFKEYTTSLPNRANSSASAKWECRRFHFETCLCRRRLSFARARQKNFLAAAIEAGGQGDLGTKGRARAQSSERVLLSSIEGGHKSLDEKIEERPSRLQKRERREREGGAFSI